MKRKQAKKERKKKKKERNEIEREKRKYPSQKEVRWMGDIRLMQYRVIDCLQPVRMMWRWIYLPMSSVFLAVFLALPAL